MLFKYVVFVTMCYDASTARAAAINAEYILQKSVLERMYQRKRNFSQILRLKIVEFTIVDSVIIDEVLFYHRLLLW